MAMLNNQMVHPRAWLRSRVCLLAASWLNRFSSLVMPTLRRASADSRVTAVRCTRCVRPAIVNHYTKIVLQTKGLTAIGGRLKIAFVPHRKRQGQSIQNPCWLESYAGILLFKTIGSTSEYWSLTALVWIGRKDTGSRHFQDLWGPEHSQLISAYWLIGCIKSFSIAKTLNMFFSMKSKWCSEHIRPIQA